MAAWACVLLTVLAAGGFPPLEQAQRQQLATASDGSAQWDEGALYPLLANALKWEPGERAGARVPDWDQLRNQPPAHRGDALLVEGQTADRRRRLRLSRSGPWGEAVTEWIVLPRGANQPIVVLLADPANAAPDPGHRQNVTLIGRFYKLWQSENLAGKPRQYPVVVARTGQLERQSPAGPAPGLGAFLAALLALTAVFAVLAWQARRAKARAPAPRGSGGAADRRQARAAHRPDDLPDDPAEALARLRRRE